MGEKWKWTVIKRRERGNADLIRVLNSGWILGKMGEIVKGHLPTQPPLPLPRFPPTI
jgi:hypothetical protein